MQEFRKGLEKLHLIRQDFVFVVVIAIPFSSIAALIVVAVTAMSAPGLRTWD